VSYGTINLHVNDPAFQGRVTACCAKEGAASPQARMTEVIWFVCTRTDIEDAYAYAMNSGNPNPGGDETVITDQMILSAVQAAPASTAVAYYSPS